MALKLIPIVKNEYYLENKKLVNLHFSLRDSFVLKKNGFALGKQMRINQKLSNTYSEHFYEK